MVSEVTNKLLEKSHWLTHFFPPEFPNQSLLKKCQAELFNECRILLHSPLFWDLALEEIRGISSWNQIQPMEKYES